MGEGTSPLRLKHFLLACVHGQMRSSNRWVVGGGTSPLRLGAHRNGRGWITQPVGLWARRPHPYDSDTPHINTNAS